MFPDYCETMPYYKYLCTWHVILLPFAMNAIDKTSYAMRQGSSLFTIASARAFFSSHVERIRCRRKFKFVSTFNSRLDVDTELPKFDLYDVAVLLLLERT